MRGYEDTYVDIVDYVIRDDRPHLGGPGRRLHLRHLPVRLPGLHRQRHAVGRRGGRGGHDAVPQRVPRRPPLRRRHHLGRQRGRGLRHIAPRDQRRPSPRPVALRPRDRPQDPHVGDRQLRLGGEPVLRGVGALQRRRAPAAVRDRRAGRGAPVRQRRPQPGDLRASADRGRAPRGRPHPGAPSRVDDARRVRRRALRARPVPRDLQPPRPERHRPRVRQERALARSVQSRGLRTRGRARDGTRR